MLGITDEEADRKFGFFLNPFEYGAPPHGGFAFGIDRLVAILAGEENIREVIAFPKTQSGTDPMTSSPMPVDAGAARRARHPRAAHELTAAHSGAAAPAGRGGQSGPVVTTGHGALRTTWSDTDPSTVRRRPPRPLVPITTTEAGKLVARSHTAGPGAPVRITVSTVAEAERGARRVEPALGRGVALVVVPCERLR